MIPPACSRSLKRSIATLAILMFGCCTIAAQEAARPDRGSALNRNYAISDIENINLENGNVQLSIPLAALPPIAGGKLSWTVSANYNSKLWDVARMQEEQPDLQWAPYVVDMPGTGGGWRIGAKYEIVFRNSNDDFSRVFHGENSGLPQYERDWLNNYNWWKVVLVMPDGSEHELRPLNQGSYPGNQDFLRGYFNVIPNGSPMRYYSLDGSYIFATISSYFDWTVYLPDGTRIIHANGIQRIHDTNGNKIKIFSDGTGDHFQDEQTGREIRVTYDPAANGGQGQYRVWYPTVGGTQHYIDVNMGTTTVQGKTYVVNDWDYGNEMVCQITGGLSTQLGVVREIIFPQTEPGQHRKFVFSYNSDTTENLTSPVNWTCNGGSENYTRAASVGWGELSRVILPPGTIQTAAYSDYSYRLNSNHDLPFSTDELAYQSITQKKLYHDGTNDTWGYSIYDNLSSMSGPDGSWVIETRYCNRYGQPNCSTDKAGLAFRLARPFVKTEKHWITLQFSGGDHIGPGGVVNFNPVVDKEYTTLTDAAGNNLKMSAKVFAYDYNGNVTQTTEYDWFDPALVSRDADGVPTGVPGSATKLRVSNSSHYNQAVGSTSTNVYAKRSLSGTPLILSAPKETTLGPSIVQLSYDGQAYGVAPTIGNLTTKKVWVDQDAKWITTSSTYGAYGNIATSTDARGKVTQYFFDSTPYALPNRVVVDPQNGTGTQTTTTAYDYWTGLVTSVTDPNNAVSTIDYTNQVLGVIDPYGRPGITFGPLALALGINQRHRTTTTYLDSARQVIVAADLNNENDKLLKTRTTADQLGRTILTESTEDGTNYTIFSNTVYQQMGRITFASNPRRASAAGNEGWTRVTKDIAGRVTEAATFYGTAQPPATGTNSNWTGSVTTAFDAEFTTVTDQAAKVRRSKTDALGRLIRVDEPNSSNSLGSPSAPTQPTAYTYDVFGNLLTVTQGTQTRTFTYDSLSRLRSAVNPESGTITYTYDDNSNLASKTDARTWTTSYGYDALNRNTTVDYSNTTVNPDINRYYDGAVNGKGRFWHDYAGGVTSGGQNLEHTAIDSYDPAGRPVTKRQLFTTNGAWSPTYQMSRYYKVSGQVTSQVYPAGRTTGPTYDNAGRQTGLSGTLGDGTNRTYASNITYTAAGQMQEERFGTTTPLYHKLRYNSRGQLYDIRLSTVPWATDPLNWNRGCLAFYHDSGYHWGGTPGIDTGSDNNGNVLRSQYYRPDTDQISTFSATQQDYTYDELNRLKQVTEWYQTGQGYTQQFVQAYLYDRWGNRTINTALTSPVVNNLSFEVEQTTNRLLAPGDTPQAPTNRKIRYDSVGNVSNDSWSGYGDIMPGVITRTYDAENHMTSARDSVGGWAYYTYNADGQRTRTKVSSQEKWFVYGFDGELVTEYAASSAAANPQKEYAYRNGQLLLTAAAADLRFLVPDHLGTPRMIADLTGSLTGIRRHDYLPFGEELPAGVGSRTVGQGYATGDGVRQKFTSQERDNETGLDYFGARYYANVQGRFTGPDELSKDSQAEEPQSWNKYTYVRSNPLRYVDPTGEKATVKIVTDEKTKKGHISVDATIAIWSDNDGSVSAEQMNEAAKVLESQIRNAYGGNFEKDGITYSVSVSVAAQAYESRDAAMGSGAMNVIKISPGDALPGVGSSVVDRGAILGRGPDTGTWSIKDILKSEGAVPAHEFIHLLGVGNRAEPNFLASQSGSERSSYASYQDYHWIFGQAIDRHREQSRVPRPVPLGILNRAPAGNGLTERRNFTSTRTLRAGTRLQGPR